MKKSFLSFLSFLRWLNRRLITPIEMVVLLVSACLAFRALLEGAWVPWAAATIGGGFALSLLGVFFAALFPDTKPTTRETPDLDFLADEGLSLVKVGNTWAVIDGNKKAVGTVHDAPHQAVWEAMGIIWARHEVDHG